MNQPDDFNDALREARERTDDNVRREQEAEIEVAWEAMSDAQREHWVGVLFRMFDDERRRSS